MKASELREKGVDDLEKELTSLLKEQFNLRMQRGSGQDVKPHMFDKNRKTIARVKTLINEKNKAGERA
jgi:large subunit ribosomal protein L29